MFSLERPGRTIRVLALLGFGAMLGCDAVAAAPPAPAASTSRAAAPAAIPGEEARAHPRARAEFGVTESTDRFLIRTFGLEIASEGRDFAWPLAGQRARALWLDARVDQGLVRGPEQALGVVRGRIGAGWQPSDRFAVEVRAGTAHVEPAEAEPGVARPSARAIPSGELVARGAGGPARELIAELRLARDAAAWDWVAPSGRILESTQAGGALTFTPPTLSALRLSAQASRRWLSDGNSRERGELSLGYRLSAEPWLVVGWFAEQIQWERPATPGYYSPASVRTTGPRAEAAFALGASRLSAVGAAQIAWLEEQAAGTAPASEGAGSAWTLALRYGDRAGWEARIGVTAQNSVQGGGRWASESAWLSASAGF